MTTTNTTRLETVIRERLELIHAEIAEALATPLDEGNYRQIQQTLKVKDIQLELLHDIILTEWKTL